MFLKEYTQNDIDMVWSERWKAHDVEDLAKNIFKNPLFVEGYKIYKKYIPPGTSSFLELGAGSGRYGLAVASAHLASSVTLTDPLPESKQVMQSVGESL